MELTKHESGYILELYGYEVHNLNLTLNKCGLHRANYIRASSPLLPCIPEKNIQDHLRWGTEFKNRISERFYIDSEDLFHICIALEYSFVVDKYHAQFICEFRDSLHNKMIESGLPS